MRGRLHPPLGAVSPRDRQGRRVLSLSGELDMGVRDEVDRQLRDHIEVVASSVVIVDLSAVTFIDSAGLDPLLSTYAVLAEHERLLALQSISASVTRLFRLLAGIRPVGLVQQTLRSTSILTGIRGVAPRAGAQDLQGLAESANALSAAVQAETSRNHAFGLLMAVHDCDAEQARLLLELVSRRRGLTVDDLAAGIVAAVEATRVHPSGVGKPSLVQAGVHALLETPVPLTRLTP